MASTAKLIIAGTGHRPDKLGGYSDEVLMKLTKLAKDNITDATSVISGMALGWDTAIALAAIELKIPLIAAIPFFGQEKMWPKISQDKYHLILEQAVDVFYICDKGYAPWKMQIRNEWMVDKCNLLLALWNGSSGGTSNCVRYAEKQNKLIKNVWSALVNPI